MVGADAGAPAIDPHEHRADYRLKKIEDLMNVRGVREKSFLSLKDLITATPPKTEK